MGNCGDSRKYSCGTKTQAVCTYYKGYLPKYSKLDPDCAVIEETTEELYKHQEEILKSIDSSKLKTDCFDYPTTEVNGEDKVMIVDILQTLQNEICEMKEDSAESDAMSLDFKCLVAPCGSPISSLKDLLQALIDGYCELKSQNI